MNSLIRKEAIPPTAKTGTVPMAMANKVAFVLTPQTLLFFFLMGLDMSSSGVGSLSSEFKSPSVSIIMSCSSLIDLSSLLLVDLW